MPERMYLHSHSPSIDDYDVGSLLGRGGFAEVYYARDKSTHEEVAIKFINKSKLTEQSMRDRVRNEIDIHSNLHHPGIVEVLKHFMDEEYVYIVMEYCCNGNMFKYLKTHGRLKEETVAIYFHQLLEAVQYLQSGHVRVIHRDLKLSNILLDKDYNVKICDFGLATQEGHPDDEHNTICGTPNYIAPEVVSYQGHSFPVDMWSLGCLLCALLTGDLPFEQNDGIKETLQRIVDGQYSIGSGISDSAQHLLESLLQSDPMSRLTVKQAMQHEFVCSSRQSCCEYNSKLTLCKNLFDSWNSSNAKERDGDPNGSYAATALVSYDGRTVDNDNRTTVNDYQNDNQYKYDCNFVEEELTHNSDLHPKQLQMIPEQQHSLELDRSSSNNEMLVSTKKNNVVQITPPHSHEPGNSTDFSHSGHLNVYPHSIRDSYPPSRQHGNGRNGRLLISHDGKSRRNSLTLSLDSSLHCGSLSSHFSPTSCSAAPTINSSMSSNDFELMSHVSNSILSYSRSTPIEPGGGRNPIPWIPARRRRSGSPGIRADSNVGRRLWVPARRQGTMDAASNQKFCYCAPRGDVLITTKCGDVVYLTYLRDKSGNLRPCRLAVRADKPLTLLLGKVTRKMCEEIRSIRELSLSSGAFHIPSQDKTSDEDEHNHECSVSRSREGGFVDNEDFPDSDLDILADKLWIKSYHVSRLPSSVKKPYVAVSHMLDAVKCRLPKLILYLTQANNTTDEVPQTAISSSEDDKAVCKCMIMCNDPLPDFSVRWADGTKLKYSLSDGKLYITNNDSSSAEHYKWEGFASSEADWTTSAPSAVRKYLLLAQSAMRRCISEDIKHQKRMEDDTSLNKKWTYPLIVVDSVHSA